MQISKEIYVDSKGKLSLAINRTKAGKWLDENGFIFDFKLRYNGKQSSSR